MLPIEGVDGAGLSTRYRRFTRKRAVLVLVATGLACCWCTLNCARSIYEIDNNEHDTYSNIYIKMYDANLYSAIAGRVRQGENYYDAAAAELGSRGYPRASIFNWRTPVYAWVFGMLPSPVWGRILLVVIASLSIGSACVVLGRSDRDPMLLAVAAGLVASYSGWLVHPYPPYFTEIWSGLFISLSCCCLSANRWGLGVVAAAAALAFRELALPYVAVMSLLAVRQRRWYALCSLFIAIVTFMVMFILHYLNVIQRFPLGVSARCTEWVALGGTSFVLSTCRMNFILAALPPWCSAIYLPLSLLGLLGWEGREATPIRWAAFTYLLIFSCVGMPFNFYWGWICVPLLFIGFCWSTIAFRDLFAVISRR